MTTDDLSESAAYRAVFDRALRANRAATDAGAASAPGGTPPIKAREETARALTEPKPITGAVGGGGSAKAS